MEGNFEAANDRLRAMDYQKTCEVTVNAAKRNTPRELGHILDMFIGSGVSTAPYPHVEFGSSVLRGRDGYYGNVIIVSCPD